MKELKVYWLCEMARIPVPAVESGEGIERYHFPIGRLWVHPNYVESGEGIERGSPRQTHDSGSSKVESGEGIESFQRSASTRHLNNSVESGEGIERVEPDPWEHIHKRIYVESGEGIES